VHGGCWQFGRLLHRGHVSLGLRRRFPAGDGGGGRGNASLWRTLRNNETRSHLRRNGEVAQRDRGPVAQSRPGGVGGGQASAEVIEIRQA